MESQTLPFGKKLNKKQLKTIQGGMLNCFDHQLCENPPCESSGSRCTITSSFCAQEECRPKHPY
ncbi:bacteriocin [Chryseobacterium sp. c4a]|uniref:bacteriocin n=1 Tax=Chryseobacterium sp. c4a TaxID=1573582 RepID=UPI001359401A|nr:bacteriocin [Chryseobacterium sp. c4a]